MRAHSAVEVSGDEELGEFTSIDSVSGVTNVRVSW